MRFTSISRTADDFQRSIVLEQIEQICRAAFGSERVVVQATELASGLFNSTYRLDFADGERVILRVAPAAVSIFSNERHLLQREQSIEPHLNIVAPLIPKTLLADFSRTILDRDYMLQTFLPGEIWDEVKGELSAADNEALWCQLAHISRKIHNVTGTQFGFPEPEPMFARWGEAIGSIAKGMRDDLVVLQLDTEATDAYLAVLAAKSHWLDEIEIPRLLHGDLWPKNVLIDRSNATPNIVGLLDAERGFWGDPMAEWVFLFFEIPELFWEEYGRFQSSTPGETFRKLAYRGMYTIQGLLEATRFGWEEPPITQKLFEITQEMRTY